MEIIVVLVIISICVVVSFPNFTASTEQARAQTAQNNLLAIYSAQQNNRNNTGAFVNFGPNPGVDDGVPEVNSFLFLNIQDDSTYNYDCGVTTANACTAQRINPLGSLTITLTLNLPVQLKTGTLNPVCAPGAGGSANWCP